MVKGNASHGRLDPRFSGNKLDFSTGKVIQGREKTIFTLLNWLGGKTEYKVSGFYI